MHAAGINCRLMGKLRSVLDDVHGGNEKTRARATHIRQLLLTEMVARVWKNQVRRTCTLNLLCDL